MCARAHTHTLVGTHTHTCTRMYTHTHVHTNTHMHTHTRAHTHKHTHARAHTDTHMQNCHLIFLLQLVAVFPGHVMDAPQPRQVKVTARVFTVVSVLSSHQVNLYTLSYLFSWKTEPHGTSHTVHVIHASIFFYQHCQ